MNLGILEISNKEVARLSKVLRNRLLSTGATLSARLVLDDDADKLSSAIAYMVKEVRCLVLLGDTSTTKLALSRYTGWAIDNIAPMTVLEGCDIMLVPIEADEAFVDGSIIPVISAKVKVAFTRDIYRVFGLTEKEIRTLLKEHMRQKKMPILIEGNHLDYEVSIKYSNKMGKISVDEFVDAVAEKLKPYIYSLEQKNLYDVVSSLLRVRGKQLAVAESFTGGAISRKITSYKGASNYFFEGIVCYTDSAKIDRLGVNPTVLDENGAVSGEVCYEMAAGLLAKGNCDIAIATTGYAQDAPEGKAGLCYIAVGDMEGVHVFQHHFYGSREDIMEIGTQTAFFYLYKLLIGDQTIFRH